MMKEKRALNPWRGRACQGPALLMMLAMVVVMQFGSAAPVRAAQFEGPQAVLRVGFSSRVFPGVDQRDAKIAMELWTRELARGMGIMNPPVTTIFRNSDELTDAVKKGALTVVTLPATEYLLIRDKTPMTPIIVAASNAGTSRQYALVVRKDSGIRSVAALRGKVIMIPAAAKNEASHTWLHVLLLRELHRERAGFFRQVQEHTSASQSILGVFFKKADAAIVSRGSLDASRVLNPQLGQQLVVLAESKPLHGDITCVPTSLNDKLRRTIEHAALHLHETTSGRQMFTLFQIDRVIPFNPAYLSGLEELLREKERLLGTQAKRR